MSLSFAPAAVTRRVMTLTLPPLAMRPGVRRLLLAAAVVMLGLAMAWLPIRAVVLLLAGALFVGLLLHRPILALYGLIPAIPFSPLLAVTVGSFKVGGMEILLALGLLAWLLQAAARPGPAPAAAAPPLLLPFLVFLGGVSLSWLSSLSIGASLVETAKWVEMLALYLLVLARLPRRQIGLVVAVILLTGAAQALLGLYQFVFKVGPPGFLLFGGRFLRAYGTFAQPNPYAGYLGLVLPLALAVTAWALEQSRGAAARTGLYLLLSGLSLGLLLAALFASQSRGAWLGFAVAAPLTLAARSRKMAAGLAVLALLGAVVLLAGTFQPVLAGPAAGEAGPGLYGIISQRVIDAVSIATIQDVGTIEVNDANFATIERLAHWQAAREMWRDHPWLGVGFGNYEVIYPAYAVGRWLNALGHAHNYLLNIGAEAGLVGLMAYLIFWIAAFRVSWLVVRRSAGFEQAVAAGGLGILTHLHVHNFFDNLYVQGMYLHVAVILALMGVIYRAQTGNLAEENRVPCRKLL